MALRALLLFSAVLLFFAYVEVSTAQADHVESNIHQIVKGANRRLMEHIDCDGQCKVRCSKSSRPNLCKRACGTCCVRCKCVPPGTSGNKQVCGTCYTQMTTHGNKSKCP